MSEPAVFDSAVRLHCLAHRREVGWLAFPLWWHHTGDRTTCWAMWNERAPRRSMCPECGGSGLVAIGRCNCGSPAGPEAGYAHERLCGSGPCPRGCWDALPGLTQANPGVRLAAG